MSAGLFETGPVGTVLLFRALGALVIIAAGVMLYRLANRLILRRAQRLSDSRLAPLPGARPGVPAILYFTTPDCLPCRTVQRPALERIRQQMGDRLQIIEVDAQARPDLARCWGVLSVPTTFIIDEQGRLRHVNHGAARAEKLLQQVGSG